MRLRVQSLPFLSGLRIRHCLELCVGRRRGLEPALLWLRRRPVATALIGPLVWEPLHAAGAALEKVKKKKSQLKCLLL